MLTDQTVGFYMETSCGHTDDQEEHGHPPLLYISLPAIMVSTVYICLRTAGNRQSTSERLHVRGIFKSVKALIYIYYSLK